MRLIIFITYQVLPDVMFVSDLHYTGEKYDFSALFQSAEKLSFAHAVGQNTVANSLFGQLLI